MSAGMKRMPWVRRASGRADPANSITMFRENSVEGAVPPGPYATFRLGEHAACPHCALVNVKGPRTRDIVCISYDHEITKAESYAFDISPHAYLIATEFRRSGPQAAARMQAAAQEALAAAARRQAAAQQAADAHEAARRWEEAARRREFEVAAAQEDYMIRKHTPAIAK